MWSLLIFLCLSITWAEAQNGRGNDRGSRQDQNGHGWDIKLAVPGEPGNDYPTLGAIPRTTFSCAGKEPGYYADTETNCQAFRVCTIGSTYGFQSFLCPNGTLFNQAVLVCDWWMKVKCENTQQFIDNNKNKFENLKLGPELMKDIKKMLTHPMRNPYDRSLMKSSQIVMQEYKAPNGQLFPNGALLSGPERVPNNVYVSAKQIQQNLIQNNPNDFIYSASTPNPQYLENPALANNYLGSLQKNEDFFQKQRQSKQYSRNGRTLSKQDPSQNTNLIASNQKGQFIQSSKSNFINNANLQLSQVTRPSQIPTFSQRQTNTAQATQTSSSQNNQRGQNKRRRLQTNDSRRKPQTNNEKQAALADSLTETQNIQNSKSNQAITDNTPPGLPKFSSEIKGKVGRELKDNLALVYSFFSDSINLGREYRNLAEQEVLSSTVTPTPAQFQNLNNQQISDITNKISNLTSSQFSSNSKFSTQHKARQIQSSRYNGISSQPTQDKLNSAQLNLKSVPPNPNDIYSGQLYRWPVPERNTNQNNAAEDLKQSSPEVEFIKAEIINLGPEPSNEPEQTTSTETLTKLLNNGNGISAHLEDKIVGTIPHPLEENKLVTYRKDRSYYLYTKLDDNPTDENVATNTQTNTNTQQNDQQMQNSNAPDDSGFQLIPSVNYELQDEKEQQLILDAFQIDEFGAPRDITKLISTTEKSKDEEIMTSSVGYSVEHPTAARRSDRLTIDPVYTGPSSYKAPQSSIGSLENRQGMQSNFNAKLEDFDNNNENGYPKQRPARRFVY